jgi:acetyl esterase/lipase
MPSELPDATVRYAGHEDAVVDVHLPERSRPGEGGTPLVVLLHGGFWKQEWDRRHTRPMARALAGLGAVVATPEYRRVRGGGGWPVTCEDVELAVRRLPELLAGLGIVAGPMTVVGHSAGGHLTLWLSTLDLPVTRAVALAPVCDLREAMRLHLGEDATQAFLDGADPAPADPMTLLDDRPPAEVVVVHGVDDDVVPISLSRGLVGRHPWIALREVPAGHMEVIDPGSSVWPTVVDALALARPAG